LGRCTAGGKRRFNRRAKQKPKRWKMGKVSGKYGKGGGMKKDGRQAVKERWLVDDVQGGVLFQWRKKGKSTLLRKDCAEGGKGGDSENYQYRGRGMCWLLIWGIEHEGFKREKKLQYQAPKCKITKKKRGRRGGCETYSVLRIFAAAGRNQKKKKQLNRIAIEPLVGGGGL